MKEKEEKESPYNECFFLPRETETSSTIWKAVNTLLGLTEICISTYNTLNPVILDCLDIHIILTCKHFFKINTSLKSALNMIECSSLGSKFIQFNKVVLNNAKYSETSHDVI